MSRKVTEETRAFWNRVARDWDTQVGDHGDSNRMLNSDPVVWRFAGDVAGLTVLDAGCGTGYLSREICERGANVIGVDFSERMIEIARAKAPSIDYRMDSCSALGTVEDASIDLVIANYLLMDTPDLDETMAAFNRVLKVGGAAIVVFSHPCFPQGRATTAADGRGIRYDWTFPYFERRKCVDPPWGHFTSEFTWFHRPLSDYWKAFQRAGFDVVDFEEPRLSEDGRHLAADEKTRNKCRSRPYSVAFKLRKTAESRRAVRVLVIDDRERVLLLRARRPDDGHVFWLAPGGGVREGESFAAAAIREVAEETGLRVDLGPWVWERRHLHGWDGRLHDQYERFFVARTSQVDVQPVRPDGYIERHRWWTLAELEQAKDDFAPRRLRELLPPLLRGEYPQEPLDCGG